MKFDLAMIYGQVIGLTSTLFMIWVFYNESLRGRGVLFLEPNRPMALFELGLAVAGAFLIVFTLFAFVAAAKPSKKADEEDSMPQPKDNPPKGMFA